MTFMSIQRWVPWLLRAAVVALVWTILGCHQIPAEMDHPAADVTHPEMWSALGEASPSGAQAWLTSFTDDRLPALVEQALAANHSYAAATARLAAAAELARIDGATRWPTLDANLNGSRSRGSPGVYGNNFSASLNIGWEVDYLGKLGDRRLAAEAELGASAADFEATRLSLVANVARAWFELLEAEAQRLLAEQTLNSFESNLRIISDQYEAGLSSALDLRLLRANVASARATLASRQQTRDGAGRLLEVLVGDYPANALTVSSDLPDLTGPPPAGLPSELLFRRPDVIAAEWSLEAAALRASAARKALFPSIRLTSQTGGARGSNALQGLLDGGNTVWTLAGGLTAPLFRGGALRAASAQQKALARAALSNYRQTALTAFQEVESALAAEGFLQEQEAALRLASEESDAAEALAWERYQKGLSDIVTPLEAQRRAVNNRQGVLTARKQRLRNRIALHLALGGAFDSLQPNFEN